MEHTRKDVSKRLGIGIETLRYYEKLGLIREPKRANNGYRIYTDEDIVWLEHILRIRDYGFSLKQIHTYLHMTEGNNEYARSEIANKIQEIDDQMGLMQKQRTVLLSLLLLSALTVVGISIFMRMRSSVNTEGSVCGSSQYSRIKVGMAKQQVLDIWGKPSMEWVKDNTGQNYFYQGANETKIKEGWIYHNRQPDNAEIYFDSSGVVIGKNCGRG